MLALKLIQQFEQHERIVNANVRCMHDIVDAIKQQFTSETLRLHCSSCAVVRQDCEGCPMVKLRMLLQ